MNWFNLFKPHSSPKRDLVDSSLYDEGTFYNRLTRDLLEAQQEVIIESPYITTHRLRLLKPVFEQLMKKRVGVFVITRSPDEHSQAMATQAEAGIQYFEHIGAHVLLCPGSHHRKLAIIDREILWEGSLNILSQGNSREFMRRIASKKLTEEVFLFLNLKRIPEFQRKLSKI